jgi:hypothetical protein
LLAGKPNKAANVPETSLQNVPTDNAAFFLGRNSQDLITAPTKKPRIKRGFSIWWAHTDSNRGPKDYELLGELLCLEKSFEGERRLA